MKIPITYHLKFWLINSFMSVATGFIVGYVFPIIPFIFLISPVIGFIIYQFHAFKYFWGSKRGKFEYSYIESEFSKNCHIVLRKKLGMLNYLKTFLHYSYLAESFEKLLENKYVLTDSQVYLVAMKLSQLARKDFYDYVKEKAYLDIAITKKPNDFLSNFWYAIVAEQTDQIETAVEHYRKAMTDKSVLNSELPALAQKQIERIKTYGPLHKPTKAALRHFFR